ncbi:hypothetical protein GCM10025862_02200 [Arsenicicoccus piscis]|uniref:ResB-like domain-containing protein n=1 Tax=Arsenicicoccus piscis TaxID=673954 RepID=A0ABQ6HL22_9MICO|nr:hypothetical protein GCM10025862_02200 [Arsenicicoccus piscis]
MRRHGSSTKDPAAHETPAASGTTETRRPDDVQQPDIGVLGLLRWAWRQLTSMRTALFLLLLLAVAAVPGSVWPQRSVDPVRVRTYLQEHTTAGPWMDRLRLFDVYSSPWFAAIYLLLFISLIGCVLPRCRVLWRETRGGPVRAPLRLARLPEHREVEVAATPEHALETARRVLGRQRFRLRPADTSVDATGAPGQATAYVSAEKGFLRELGNLVFHLALIGVLIGVAVGHLWGWKGTSSCPRLAPSPTRSSPTPRARSTLSRPARWLTSRTCRRSSCGSTRSMWPSRPARAARSSGSRASSTPA